MRDLQQIRSYNPAITTDNNSIENGQSENALTARSVYREVGYIDDKATRDICQSELLLSEANVSSDFRFEWTYGRITHGFENNRNDSRGSGKFTSARVWIDVSPLGASGRNNALSSYRTRLQLPVNGRYREIGGVCDYGWIRCEYKTSTQVNYVCQVSIEDAGVCDWSGYSRRKRVKSPHAVSSNRFAIAVW
jgi:hypothetical protein